MAKANLISTLSKALGMENVIPHLSAKQLKRFNSFFDENGNPTKIRCYDNDGETIDRFTICFTGNYRKTTNGEYYVLIASCHPTHPQGVGQHMSYDIQIDRPRYAHLGKKIRFDKLPPDVQDWVILDYAHFWGFIDMDGKWC